MRVGTKSLLWGAHCVPIHTAFVAIAWWKLYGFPWDLRLWVAFLVHDWGYWGKEAMDDPEGETHPELGAKIMHRLFDHGIDTKWIANENRGPFDESGGWYRTGLEGSGWDGSRPCREWSRKRSKWRDFALYHSRFYAKRDGATPSRLCMADKLAAALEPWWLYLPRVVASGEVKEYMEHLRAKDAGEPSKYAGDPTVLGGTAPELAGLSPLRAWHKRMSTHCRKFAYEHRWDAKDFDSRYIV